LTLLVPYGLGTDFQVGFEESDEQDDTDPVVVVEMFLPREGEIPNVAEYKYNAKLDDITSIMLKQRERSDNYEDLVAQIALATMFRIFHDAQTPRIQRIIGNNDP